MFKEEKSYLNGILSQIESDGLFKKERIITLFIHPFPIFHSNSKFSIFVWPDDHLDISRNKQVGHIL